MRDGDFYVVNGTKKWITGGLYVSVTPTIITDFVSKLMIWKPPNIKTGFVC